MWFVRSAATSLLGASSNPEVEEETNVDLLTRRLVAPQLLLEDAKLTVGQLAILVDDREERFGDATLDALLKVVPKIRSDGKTLLELMELLEKLLLTEDGKEIKQKREAWCFKGRHLVEGLLSLLSERSPRIRLAVLELLGMVIKCSLKNQTTKEMVEDIFIATPQSIAGIVDALAADQIEPVRNQALLLMTALSQSREEIQKIIAFEGVFESLLSVVEQEGVHASSSAVVADALAVVRDLMAAQSNLKYFRETDCLIRLRTILEQIAANLHSVAKSGNSAQQQSDVDGKVISRIISVAEALAADVSSWDALVKKGIVKALVILAIVSVSLTSLHSTARQVFALLSTLSSQHEATATDILLHSVFVENAALAMFAGQSGSQAQSPTVSGQGRFSTFLYFMLLHRSLSNCSAAQNIVAKGIAEGSTTVTEVQQLVLVLRDIDGLLSAGRPMEVVMASRLLRSLISESAEAKELLISTVFSKTVKKLIALVKSLLGIQVPGVEQQAPSTVVFAEVVQLTIAFVDSSPRASSHLTSSSSTMILELVEALQRPGTAVVLRGLIVLLLISVLGQLPESASDEGSLSRPLLFQILRQRLGIELLEETLTELSTSQSLLRWTHTPADQWHEVVCNNISSVDVIFDPHFGDFIVAKTKSLHGAVLQMYASPASSLTANGPSTPASVRKQSSSGLSPSAEMENLRNTIARQEEELQRLRKENASLKQPPKNDQSAGVQQQSAELIRLQDDVRSRDFLIQTLRTQIQNLKDSLEEKDRDIRRTQQDLSSAKSALEFAKNQFAVALDHIEDSLRRSLDGFHPTSPKTIPPDFVDAELVSTRRLETIQNGIDALSSTISHLNSKNQDIERDRDELFEYLAELEDRLREAGLPLD
jgi:predicted  nucleic acid-binding Zn-ribbon protein